MKINHKDKLITALYIHCISQHMTHNQAVTAILIFNQLLKLNNYLTHKIQ